MKDWVVNAVLSGGETAVLANLDGTTHCPNGETAQVIAAFDDCGLTFLVEARDEDHAYDVAEAACKEINGDVNWIMDDVGPALSQEDEEED